MDRGDSLESRSIDKSQTGTGCVNGLRLQLALPHLSPELLDIEPGRRRFTAQDRAALAMDDPLARALTVNLIVDLAVVVRQQRDAHFPARPHREWLRPNHIEQLQHCRFRPV